MSAIWPGSVATDADLYIAVNALQTTLAGSINNSVTTITVASTTGFPTTGAVTIDNEVIFYTGISGPQFTGCIRGSDGTLAASHNSGVPVGATIVAAHHNTLRSEIEAIETSLDLTASRALTSNGSGRVAVSSVTSTELGYLSGVTSAIQTQLNSKVFIAYNVVNVMDYGADNTGATYSTTAIDNAAAVAFSGTFNRTLYFPAGQYKYNGSGLSNANMSIIGDGSYHTKIILDAGKYFVDSSVLWNQFTFRNMTISSGAGAIRHSYTGVNVQQIMTVDSCIFSDYTVCAISDNGSDEPFWHIDNCFFQAFSAIGTIGIALGGLTDNCIISRCNFNSDQIDIKLTFGGNNAIITDCAFARFDAYAGTSRAYIWIVPRVGSTNSGQGLNIKSCRFGNEQLDSADYMILYADEGAGADRGTKLFTVAADSTGFISGHLVSDCYYSGVTNSPPVIYSTTPNIDGCQYSHFTFSGSTPSYFLQFRTAPTADRTSTDNYFGPFIGAALIEPNPVVVLSNGNGLGYLNDPQHMLSHATQQTAIVGGVDPVGYIKALPTAINSFTTSGSATISPITDSQGGSDAAEVTMSGTDSIFGQLTQANVIAGIPLWIEFDVLNGSSSLMASLDTTVEQSGGGAVHFRRQVAPGTTWNKVRLLHIPRSSAANLYVFFRNSTVSGTKIKIGRVKVYTSSEPVWTTTASRAMVTDTNGLPTFSAVTATELGYLSGVTSAIQTQLGTKAPIANPTFTGVVTLAAGSVSAPSINFSDAGTGFYKRGTNSIGATVNGAIAVTIDSSGMTNKAGQLNAQDGSVSAPGVSFENDLNNGAYRIGTDDWALSAGGVKAVELTANGVSILGTNTNDSAAAGFVGEYVESVTGVVTAGATTVWTNVTSISLTAGDWDVSGDTVMDCNTASTTDILMAISVNSGTTTTDQVFGDNQVQDSMNGSTTAMRNVVIPRYRMKLTGTTTVYLKFNMTYSTNTPRARASKICARRRR